MRSTFMNTTEQARADRKWYIIDATDLVLGRLSTAVATVLKGKHKPTFTPHIDGGDYVIIINAEKVALTGNKLQDKKYYRHSHYAGGLKQRTAQETLDQFPEKVIEFAVKGMLPKGKLGADMYRRLYVYAGPNHEQAAQKPQPFPLEVK
jgi:large subunit ribosomal protein L13